MKKLRNYLVFYILFFLFAINANAFEAKLQLDKNQTDINDTINLRVEVTSEQWWQIAVKEIKGLENFDVVWQSQSQSSASNIAIVNWQSQTKTETKLNLDLTLKAKTKWDFEIWPAILTDWSWEVTTNNLKINVSWDNLFVNNNHIKINNNQVNNQWNTNNTKQEEKEKKEEKQDKIGEYENTTKKDFDENSWLYLLWFILLLILAWVFYTFKKNPELLEKIVNNEINKENEKQEKEIIKEQVVSDIKEEIKKEVPKTKQKIIYPNIEESDFITKITQTFKYKLASKYDIESIETKTFDEILWFIEDKDEIKEIINLLNKAKYSNIDTDNEKILEMVKWI